MGGVCKTTVHQIDSHAKVRRYEPPCDLRSFVSMAYLSDNGKAQGEGWFAYCSAAKTDL